MDGTEQFEVFFEVLIDSVCEPINAVLFRNRFKAVGSFSSTTTVRQQRKSSFFDEWSAGPK